MVGHGGIVGFEERTDMRAVAKHLLHFGAAECCGKCFPCRIGLQRAHAMFDDDEPRRPRAARGAAGGARARQPVRARRRHAGADPQPARALPRGAGARVIDDHDRRRGGRGPARDDHPRGRPRHPQIPTLCFDDRQAPFGACRVCLVGVEGAPGPVASCTTQVRDGHDGRHAATRPPAASRPRSSSSCCPSSRGRPAEHTELAQVARMLDVGEPRWPGASSTTVEHDERHPYLAFQHEWCISCGRCVRACDEVQGTFALTATGRGFGANIAAGLDEGFRVRLRLLRRVRRHLPDRRHHRDLTATPDRANREVSMPIASTRPSPPPAATAASAAASRRTRATARSPRSAPRSTGPPTRATPASRAASRTSSRRQRDRLTAPADPRERRASGSRPGRRRSTASRPSSTGSRPSTARTRSPASPPRARPTRTATRCSA